MAPKYWRLCIQHGGGYHCNSIINSDCILRSMLTLVLIFFPFLAALGTLILPRDNAKMYSFVSSLIQLGLTAYAFTLFLTQGAAVLAANYEWVPNLGISLQVGLDGISILLVALTNILVPLIILSSFRNNYSNPSAFYGLILLMQFALIGVFAALFL